MPKSNTYGLSNLKQKIIKTIIFSVTGAIFGLSLMAIRPVEVQSAPSTYLNFQARLLSNSGAIVPDGNYHVEFKLYNQATLGSALWTETRTTGNLVSVKNGYLSVHLGSVNAFPGTINWSEEHWLTMNIGGSGGAPDWDGEMNPRIRLTAVPFAFQSEQMAKTVGSNKGSLKFGSVTNDPTLVLPNESGTLCVQNSSNCGFLQGSGTAFLQGGNDFGGTTNGVIGTVNDGALDFITNNTTRMTLQASGNLTVDSNTFYVDAANNRVGIGTATPGVALDVNGEAKIRNNLDVDGVMAVGNLGTPFNGRALTVNHTFNGTSGVDCQSGCWGLYSRTVADGPANANHVAALYGLVQTADTSFTLNNGYGMLIGSAVRGAGSTFTNNYGIKVQSQTAANNNNFGIAIDTASTQTLWLQGDAGTANTGIGFGSTRDTNLYRSAAGVLTTNANLVVQGTATNMIAGSTNFDTNTLFVDAVNNRVGIGTASPLGILNIFNSSTDQNLVRFRSNSNGYLGAAIVLESANVARGRGLFLTTTDKTHDAWFVGSGYSSADFMIGSNSSHSLTGVGGAYRDTNAALIVKNATKLIGVNNINPTGQLHVTSGSDARRALVVQGASGQTANLQEWQSSTGTILASVNASGVGSFANLLQAGNQVCDASNNCSYAPTTGGTGYIQNQTAVSQTAGFNISGSGIIGGNLTVDTNTLFVDAANNRVGIGTATPSETLDVAGNARVLGSMALGNNTSTASAGTALAINHVTNAAADPLQCLFGCYAMALISRINTTNTVAGIGVGTYAQTGTVAGSFTLAQANGMRIDSTALGSGTTITDNYGMYIANQTAGVNDYGLYIQGADTYALWIDSGVTRLDGDVIVNGGNFTSRPAVDSPIGYRVQNANGATLLSVDSSQASNIAANSGAEVSGTFATNWSSVGSSTITRTTTAANVAGGDAAVSVAAGTASGNGVRNNLASNPLTNTQYTISFSAKLGSGSAFTDLEVGYSYNGGTSFTSCNNYSTRTITTTDWVKVSCSLTTPANAVTNPDLIIRQPTSAGSARTFYVDNLTMMAFSDSTTTSTLRVGGPTSQGLTLLTLDSFAERPWSGSDNSLYGSMYYDTTLGKIQCYESDGWGACGGAPDNIVNLVPEYAGSVLNGTGVGTMTADLCSDTLNINDSGANAVCGTGQSYNFYKWTSPQATEQTYSVYISYQLPATFNGFADQDTIRLTGRTSSTSGNNGITFALYQANGVQCGATTAVNDSVDTWQTTTLSGDETACTFAPNDIITFRINMTAMNNSSAYVSNFSFTTLGK